jgi:molecular chaperone GrpE
MSEPKADEAVENAAGADEAGEVVEALPAEQADGPPDPHALGFELPEDSEEATAFLLTEVAKARTDAGSYLEDLQRVAADFDNFRKRTVREQAAMHERATEKVVRGLLPVLDTFDAALASEPGADSERQMYSGMLNTREQLLKALEAEGLEVIPTHDQVFDPEVHEPVGAPGGTGTLSVSQELRRGYRLNGKVVRAALVMLEVSE